MSDQITSITSFKTTLLDLAVRYGPRLVTAILILVAGVLVQPLGESLAAAGAAPPGARDARTATAGTGRVDAVLSACS